LWDTNYYIIVATCKISIRRPGQIVALKNCINNLVSLVGGDTLFCHWIHSSDSFKNDHSSKWSLYEWVFESSIQNDKKI